MGIHSFPKVISPIDNVMTQLRFKLDYNDVTVQLTNHTFLAYVRRFDVKNSSI